jgi:hypothetical protein
MNTNIFLYLLEYITELLPETDSEQEPVYECLICGQKVITQNFDLMIFLVNK